MSNITTIQYDKEIESIALEIAAEAMAEADNDREAAEESIYDYRLHEWIDGHQWVIYYAYNDDVLRESQNENAWQDCYSQEDLGRVVAERGIDSAKAVMTYFAMYQDVSDKISDALDEIEEQEVA